MESQSARAIDEYTALLGLQQKRPLSAEQEQRLELLRDVLLELGALPEEGSALPIRPARVEAVLDLSFATQDDVVRAYSKNIGAGGLAIRTSRALPVGSMLELRITLPDAPELLVAQGQVAWSREEGMGVAFTQLPAEGERRLKALLVKDASLLNRVRNVLRTDVRELLTSDVRELGGAPAAAAKAAEAVEVDTRPLVLVRLSDARLMALVTELFTQKGIHVVTKSDTPVPLIVVDASSALDVLTSAARIGTRTVMVNVSGPDSLVGRLSHLNPAAYVRHPANAAAVFHAVERLLLAASGRPGR
ncbi:PilZ domain-containing protein [Corallococcus macrosporus]|uniref:Cyclic nucleotide-binding protein n=1 Tax=Corallococcus macrosporus DSM 14697 TaxID=1189310 RepID=A0A250K1I5_9BACT|nr:PilZ domain-containing protein [Corallococcus macrosporus]ATB49607.1 cyclic nucleotide-binding protein [Corallococcus macrosporus DSM 14697]